MRNFQINQDTILWGRPCFHRGWGELERETILDFLFRVRRTCNATKAQGDGKERTNKIEPKAQVMSGNHLKVKKSLFMFLIWTIQMIMRGDEVLPSPIQGWKDRMGRHAKVFETGKPFTDFLEFRNNIYRPVTL